MILLMRTSVIAATPTARLAESESSLGGAQRHLQEATTQLQAAEETIALLKDEVALLPAQALFGSFYPCSSRDN